MSRAWLAPLTPLYGAAVGVKNLAYENRWLAVKRLRWPVVSIGNLSVGGSGKTPLTIRLAELLSAEGFHVDVLSRGYGRSSRSTERVDPVSALYARDADRFGDEPLLISQRTGVPVFVGASRFDAGRLAEQELASGIGAIHLLDDGFQHRQLARDVDIVLVHHSDFLERLLPAGRMREPLGSLRRASFVVVREEDAGLEAEIRKQGVTAPLWRMRRVTELSSKIAATPRRAIAFCAIARPEEFFAALDGVVHLEQSIAFADHHRYTKEDMARLAASAGKIQPDLFVTTEKDAVKLDSALRQVLVQIAPLDILRLSVTLRDEASVLQQLRAKLPVP